ncbi:MAG TPA: hypothetical protein PLF26_04560 [Blastocatellia bacterium]|nr:hypothetical protein [Blastocatellia bacterium]
MMRRSWAGPVVVLGFAVATILVPLWVSRAEPVPANGKLVFHSSLTIRADPTLNTAQVRLSRNAANAIASTGSGATNFARTESSWGNPALRTAAIGIALSGAIVFGGLWAQRRRHRADGRVVGALIVGFLVLACTTITVANMPPPSKYIGDLRKAVPANSDKLSGPIDFVVDDTLDSSELVVPTNDEPKPGN